MAKDKKATKTGVDKNKFIEKYEFKRRPIFSRVVIGDSIKTALDLNRHKFSAIADQCNISISTLYNYGSKDVKIASKEKLMTIASILNMTYDEDWVDNGRKDASGEPIGSVVAEFKEMKHVDLVESLLDMNPQLREMEPDELKDMSVDEMVRIAIQPELKKRLDRRSQVRSSVMAEGHMKAKAKEDNLIPVVKEITLSGEYSSLPTDQTQMYMIPPVRLRKRENLFGLQLDLNDIMIEGQMMDNPYLNMFKRGTILILDNNPGKIKVGDKIVMTTMDGELHFGQLSALDRVDPRADGKVGCFAMLNRMKDRTGHDDLTFVSDPEKVREILKERESGDPYASAVSGDLLANWWKIVSYESDPFGVENAPF